MPVTITLSTQFLSHRGWSRVLGSSAAALAFAGASLAATVSVQPEPAKKPTANGAPIFVADFAGLPSMLVDKKDQGLKNALGMIPARLRELPNEVPGMDQIPPPVIEALLTLLTQPTRVAITFDDQRQDEGMFGLGAVLSFGPGEEQRMNELHGIVNAMLSMSGAAADVEVSEKYDQMLEFPSPAGGIVRYGPRKAGPGWRYELHAGINVDPDSVFTAIPAAANGVTPLFRGALDLRPVGPMIQEQIAAMDPNGEITGQLESMGVIGDAAVKYTWQSGYTKDEQLAVTTMEGMKPHAKALSMSTASLKDSIYAMIPADASVAVVGQRDLAGQIEMIEQALLQGGGDPLQQIEDMTGVDIINDVAKCLGSTFGFYMSESTGGQLGSIIAFISLDDRARFEQAHSKLVGFANTMLNSPDTARGYVRIRPWQDGETKLFSLSFAGLPVPAEVTWALHGDWLVIGAMPQSTLSATRQIAGKGDKGLRANKSFTAVIPADKELNAFSFVDTPRIMKDGYQYVSLMGAAVANAARSPSNPQREPGLVVPPLNELREGARPMYTISYWKGNDYITESHADRSVLVNACGIGGAVSPFVPLITFAVGAASAAGNSFTEEFAPAFDAEADFDDEMMELLPFLP